MTNLLKDAMARLRLLSSSEQDRVARTILLQIEEEPEPGDLAAIEEAHAKR